MKTTCRTRFCVIALVVLFSLLFLPTARSRAQDFDREIAPLIAERCLSCHSGGEPQGKLNLTSKRSTLTGGDSGPAVVAGKLAESLLWSRIDSDEMPPKQPLTADEKTLLKRWIAAGAKWGTDPIDPFRLSTDARAGYDWWSLQPLTPPEPPTVSRASWDKNPIDAFILQRLTAAGLTPSAKADKRTLIRRLSFDLLGLPPTPAQVENFLNDTSKEAYAKIVDRMLASPHYGERWARHWLDVVGFGESHGFEYDQPRDHAWHYRNWVIDALNRDLPYDEFARRQLAGDVLRPEDPDSFAATGFLVANAHNTTLPSSQKMRMTMAQDELEQLVGVVGQTFLGLTVNCARCHDHKFDPISQREYYRFAATLAGVTHGERDVPSPITPEHQQRIKDIEAALSGLRNDVQQMEDTVRTRILSDRSQGKVKPPAPPQPFASWEFAGNLKDAIGKLDAGTVGKARVEQGSLVLDGKSAYAETARIPVAIEEKTLEAWVQLDNLTQRGGGVISLQTLDGKTFDAIVFGERDPRQWMAGSNFFRRTQPFKGDMESTADTRPVHIAIVYAKDGKISAYRNGVPYGEPYQTEALKKFDAGNSKIVFGLRHAPAGSGKMLAGKIQRARFYTRALTAEEVSASFAAVDHQFVSQSQILAGLAPNDRKKLSQHNLRIKQLDVERTRLKATETRKVYTNIPRNPGVTHWLRRGNVADPGDIVQPSGLRAVHAQAADFNLSPTAGDAERRKQLAAWVTHRDNPLFARVIVNRLWHYHFGQGLVTTPNDFGYNGGRASHPQLLDHLALALQRHDFRLKPIHRLIVTSAAYRQASRRNETAEKVDADNRLLWRRSPQRLEAEAIRDAIVFIAGQLDPQVGGRGYRDVRHYKYKGSNFYEPVAETAPGKRRRTVYRFSPRGGRNPFLDTFDCPDPSAAAPSRVNTTTPLQALTLMNNGFVFHMADELAARVNTETDGGLAAQVQRVYQLAYGRPASDAELRRASAFAAKHGLPALCRVIFNSNEFVFVQ